MAAAGHLNQMTATVYPLAGQRATAMSASNSNSKGTDSASSAAGITANDFLTLLVTEMKNQDPTANTDPNQYINQLVNVNSLQQLISINETLKSANDSSGTNAETKSTVQTATANSAAAKSKVAQEALSHSSSAAVPGTNPTTTGEPTLLQSFLNKLSHGNLSVPAASPAADRLANALGGRNATLVSK